MWSSQQVRGDEMAWLSTPLGSELRRRAEENAKKAFSGVEKAKFEAEFETLEQQLTARFAGSTGDEEHVVDRAGEACYEDLDILLTQLMRLRDELEELGFGSGKTSIMFARYPGGGARYAKHRDALPSHAEGTRRRLTLVYYLNEDWSPTNGGCLRAYLPQAAGGYLDVEPRLDRLLIFASEWLEHEVLPTYFDRLAITAWFY